MQGTTLGKVAAKRQEISRKLDEAEGKRLVSHAYFGGFVAVVVADLAIYVGAYFTSWLLYLPVLIINVVVLVLLSLNAYAFANCDPINNTDATGRSIFSEFCNNRLVEVFIGIFSLGSFVGLATFSGAQLSSFLLRAMTRRATTFTVLVRQDLAWD